MEASWRHNYWELLPADDILDSGKPTLITVSLGSLAEIA